MPRKGCQKVRTGCRTCRVRKVKCDEKKPFCNRCTSTGRQCDGYPTSPVSALCCYRPSHLFQSVDHPSEGRALQFFCETAGPCLGRPFDPYFWTHLVIQFSNFEPAVRHAVVAISSLYEDLHLGTKSSAQLAENGFALRHYNYAISNLRKIDNEPLVLLVCILFICVEILQGNRETAIQHGRHGIALLRHVGEAYPWTNEYLLPILSRLSFVPLFFGMAPEKFPMIPGPDCETVPEQFQTFGEAESFMDRLFCRTIRLVRRGDTYRIGDHHEQPVPEALASLQASLHQLLASWRQKYADLANRYPSKAREAANRSVIARYHVAFVFANLAFATNESLSDQYTDRFRAIVQECEQIAPAMVRERGSLRPKFSFEVGWVPMASFVITKCRELATRLKALQLMKEFGGRENLWDTEVMYPLCRRLIEIEHDVVLNDSGELRPETVATDYPPEQKRAKSFSATSEKLRWTDDEGNKVMGRMGKYWMRADTGKLWIRWEFLHDMNFHRNPTIKGTFSTRVFMSDDDNANDLPVRVFCDSIMNEGP